MPTIATIALPATSGWNISIGGGWIVLVLIGMGVCCFISMLGSMWLMRDGRGWAICDRHWPQETTHRDVLGSTAERHSQCATSSRAEES